MNTSALATSALLAALAMPFAMTADAQSGPAPEPTYKAEKCFGVAKAGRNDCQTSASSCAGTSRRDNQLDAWIYVPAGTCDKIVGATVKS